MTTGSKVAIAAVGVILLAVAWAQVRGRQPAGAPKSPPARLYPTVATFGCVAREDVRRAVDLHRQGDAEVARLFLSSAILAKRCQPIAAMETVYEDGGDRADWLQVHRHGDPTGLWVIGPQFTRLP